MLHMVLVSAPKQHLDGFIRLTVNNGRMGIRCVILIPLPPVPQALSRQGICHVRFLIQRIPTVLFIL